MPDASRHTDTRPEESSFYAVLICGVAGAAVTLCTSALFMLAMSEDVGAIASAQRMGTRLTAYVTMVLGGLAGAALGPGFLQRRRESPARGVRAVPRDGPYPMALLGGLVAGLIVLGLVYSLAQWMEPFCQLLLALVLPGLTDRAAWLSLAIAFGSAFLVGRVVASQLDEYIHRERTTVPVKPIASMPDKPVASAPAIVTKSAPATRRRLRSEQLDRVLCIVIGAGFGLGMTLYIAMIGITIFQWRDSMTNEGAGGQRLVLLTATFATAGAIAGAALGRALDRYLSERRRPRPVVAGTLYGYTPLAWVGGILAARLSAGVAVVLAQFVFAPAALLTFTIAPKLVVSAFYFVTVVAWMLIIGRAVARAIDGAIAKRQIAGNRAEATPPG